ncbi:hypothetical protein [Nostoc sp. CHAB 5715]|uniref:hypothetical protein n=1 Tax=Nostoc sp. CHAB 5715 TaxID=2780400 RepID=UPI001E598B64|nr:hypothetical protein [Nostoc sp. CHAB 5715]
MQALDYQSLIRVVQKRRYHVVAHKVIPLCPLGGNTGRIDNSTVRHRLSSFPWIITFSPVAKALTVQSSIAPCYLTPELDSLNSVFLCLVCCSGAGLRGD